MNTPHYDYPFRLNSAGDGAVVLEQDSEDEVSNCVEVILSTRRGERVELSDFGIDDQAFRQNGIDVGHVLAQVRKYEDRADLVIDPGQIEDLVQEVGIQT